jgi:heterodisulfide reductase subunit A
MNKIGVFCCWCGTNIAGVLDLDRTLEEVARLPGVVHAEYYKYFCSQQGQEMVEKAIKENELTGVVVAACSPSMHEGTFRRAAERAGLNQYQVEIANVREQCSWVHQMEHEAATDKAISIIAASVEKARQNEPLFPASVSVVPRALVLGAGISGIQAAIDIANSGYEVILVEKEPSIGGHMAQLSETFPTLDCSQCIMTPKMVEVAQHEKVRLMTYATLEDISGNIGNFHATIRMQAPYVDRELCTGCGVCIEKCPVTTTSEFNCGLDTRKAIYVRSPQAVPNAPVIDAEHCLYLSEGKCGICKKVCEIGAVDYEQVDQLVEVDVGAVVVATGYDEFDATLKPELGFDRYDNVITGLEMERLCSASGPTQGKLEIGGRTPGDIVFIQCVGSRDETVGNEYCSRICCMSTAKQAYLAKKKIPGAKITVFYMDIRAFGKGFEEFYDRVRKEGVIYRRGSVSEIYRRGDRAVVRAEDTLLGEPMELEADLVVLAAGLVPRPETNAIAKLLRLSDSQDGFLKEAHPKLYPVETASGGVFLAGCCQGPKDIPDAVAQAGCAASKVLGLLSARWLASEAQVAVVDEEQCVACGMCVDACPYQARTLDLERNVAEVEEHLCQGCGACVTACLNKACELRNLTSRQVGAMISALGPTRSYGAAEREGGAHDGKAG